MRPVSVGKSRRIDGSAKFGILVRHTTGGSTSCTYRKVNNSYASRKSRPSIDPVGGFCGRERGRRRPAQMGCWWWELPT